MNKLVKLDMNLSPVPTFMLEITFSDWCKRSLKYDLLTKGHFLTDSELKERDRKIWEAARDTVECTPQEWDALFRNLKYHCFDDYESSQAEGGE